MKTLYEATSTAVGGRGGHVSTEDGKIDHKLSVPKSMGGDGGDGINPEQLFGCAYAACFGGAIKLLAGKKRSHCYRVLWKIPNSYQKYLIIG